MVHSTMSARGIWAAINAASREPWLMLKQSCVSVKILPVVTQVRGGKHFNRRRVFNRYIKEKYPKIDVSFVRGAIEKQDKRLLDNFTDEVPDYQQTLLRESKRRGNIYEMKKSMKLLKLDHPQSSVKLTDDQITHIKLLHEENPEDWNKTTLAAALNVPIQAVNSALKRRQMPDRNGDNTQKLQQTREVTQLQPYTALPTDPQENVEKTKPSTKPVISPWFKEFKTGTITNPGEYFEEFNQDGLEMGDDEWMDLDEHAEELYVDIEEECDEEEKTDVVYEDDDEEVMLAKGSDSLTQESSHEQAKHFEEDNDEDETSDGDFKIETKDGITYFDKSGRFLFRLP